MDLDDVIVDEFSAYFHADDPSASPEMIDAHLDRMARDSGERLRHAVPPATRSQLIALLRALRDDRTHRLHEQIANSSLVSWTASTEEFDRLGRLVDAIIAELERDDSQTPVSEIAHAQADAAHDVTRVIYESGSEHVPTSDLGRVVLRLDGESELAELLHVTRDARCASLASLPTTTWNHVVATMQRCGFPHQPPIGPAPPGTTSTTLTWHRGGIIESVSLRRSPEYRDVNSIMWAIISQLAPDAAPGIPSEWLTAETRVENIRGPDVAIANGPD